MAMRCGLGVVLSAAATMLAASAAAAQQPSSVLYGTASIGLIGQQTSMLGSLWPGVVGTAGFSVRLAPFLAVRAEGEAAGFLTGGSAEADCLPNASCLSAKTAGGMGGGSALIVVRHDGFPLFAGAGVGTWRTTSGDDRMHSGVTYLGGLMLSTRRAIAIEARFNHPSTAIGILTSTLSFALRFSP